jgi:hypothetical protein
VPRRAVAFAGALAIVVAVTLLPSPTPARASCVAPPPLDEALLFGEVVFVGTVTGVENLDRWATVAVEERWKGADDLPDTVQVRGGPGPGTATSVDTTFSDGVRYLFFTTRGPGYLEDNACSSTQRWTDELATHRPADVSVAPAVESGAPVGGIEVGDVITVAGLVLALLVAIIAYLLVLRARRRPPDWMR